MSDQETTYDAGFFRAWMSAASAAVDREADLLTELDSAIGDADHGANLKRGFAAVSAALEKEPPATPGAVLATAGRQLISTVGGASGPLYGTLLRRTGKALGEAERVSRAALAEALAAGVAAVAQLGGAAVGDKTMLDALTPAVGALGTSFAAAREAAEAGALATVPLVARKGRASYLGERSAGHQDPGATSSALLFATLAETADADAATPDATAPAATPSLAAGPDAAGSEAFGPGAAGPATSGAGRADPDAAAPDATPSLAARPDAAGSDSPDADTSGPVAPGPGTASPDAPSPGAAGPGAPDPDAAGPELAG